MRCLDCKSYEATTRWCLYGESYVRHPSAEQRHPCKGFEGPGAEYEPDSVGADTREEARLER